MFLSRNKKNNVYPSKPQFYYIKVSFKVVNIIYTHVFVMTGQGTHDLTVSNKFTGYSEHFIFIHANR